MEHREYLELAYLLWIIVIKDSGTDCLFETSLVEAMFADTNVYKKYLVCPDKANNGIPISQLAEHIKPEYLQMAEQAIEELTMLNL